MSNNNNENRARKLSFQEVWESATVFLNNEEVESEIDERIDEICRDANKIDFFENDDTEVADIVKTLQEIKNGLEIILADISLSKEKFCRIISLLRKINIIPGGFSAEDVEWSFKKVKNKIKDEDDFAYLISRYLLEGHNDSSLIHYLPRYYREKLNLSQLGGESPQKRRLKFKESITGTYASAKGRAVENLIRQEIERAGVSYGSGRSYIVNTDVDWAIPSIEDPHIIIMVSYQETTGSGQSNKTRDMFHAFQRVQEHNFRNSENRVFINFVDGGGWLARKNDFRRLVEQCHYFLNVNNLDMLEFIINRHLP